MKKRGAPYPVELRERVVALVDDGKPHEVVAELMRVGVATVRRWLRARRERNDVAPLPHGGGRRLGLDADDETTLRELVAEKPDRTIAELTAHLVEKRDKKFSRSAVSRALARLGLVLKKSRSRPASETVQTSKRRATSSSRNSSRSTRLAATSSTRPLRTSR